MVCLCCPLLSLCVISVPAHKTYTGDASLRVNAAVSFMLVTRRALPAHLISEPEVLSGAFERSFWSFQDVHVH